MKASRRYVLAAGVIATQLAAVSKAAILAARTDVSEGDPLPLEPEAPPVSLADGGEVARLGGVDLWYWELGKKGAPTIILLHPGTGSGEVWGYQAAPFADAGFRVVGYSRRGFLRSTRGDPANPGTASDDLRLLLDHLDIRQCHIVGTAAGAFVATAFAVSWPERVASLCLACSLLSPSDPVIGRMAASLRGPWYDGVPHDVRELAPSYRMINPQGVEKWNEFHARSRGDNPPISQPFGRPVTLDHIEQLEMPVLLVAGDADLLSPPPIARLLHRSIPGSELVVIPECGHSAYWERPGLFNAAVVAFLEKHARERARAT